MAYKIPTEQRTMIYPINLIFRQLQNRLRVRVWLSDNDVFRMEGRILGFDEFLNLVMDDCEEGYVVESNQRKKLGRVMLRGDNVTLIQNVYLY